MSLGRVIGILVVVAVLFAIISNPLGSADTVRTGLGNVGDGATQITVFLRAVVQNISVDTNSSGSGIGDPVYPSGGVETGDGSTPVP